MEKCASYLSNAYSYGESLAHAEIEKFAREGQDQTTAQHVSTGLAGIPGLGVLGAPIAAPDGTGFGSFGATALGQGLGGAVGGGIGLASGISAAKNSMGSHARDRMAQALKNGGVGALLEMAENTEPEVLKKGLGSLVRRPLVGGLLGMAAGMAAGGAGMNYLHQRMQRDHGTV